MTSHWITKLNPTKMTQDTPRNWEERQIPSQINGPSKEFPMATVNDTPKWELEFIEKGAELEHERWANWQRYLHGKCIRDAMGNLIISAKNVSHWERQIVTLYEDLTEEEKDSDRKEVEKYLPLIRHLLSQRTEEIKKIVEGMKAKYTDEEVVRRKWNEETGHFMNHNDALKFVRENIGRNQALSDLLQAIEKRR